MVVKDEPLSTQGFILIAGAPWIDLELERVVAIGEMKTDAPQRPDVRRLSIDRHLPLRGEETVRAAGSWFLIYHNATPQVHRLSNIKNDGSARADADVGRFDIAMDVAMVMQELDARERITEQDGELGSRGSEGSTNIQVSNGPSNRGRIGVMGK